MSSRPPCVSPQPPDTEVVLETGTVCAVSGSQDEEVLNSNVDAEVPGEVHADEDEAAAQDGRGGDEIDEGVVNDSENFKCVPCDPEGAEYTVSPDPG